MASNNRIKRSGNPALRSASRPVRRLASGEPPQVVQLTTSDEPQPVELIPVFSIDGVEYGMPAHIKRNLALKYLRMIRTRGQSVADAWMIEEVFGAEAFEALMNHDDLTDDQFAQVMAIVEGHVLGQMEQLAGNG